MSAFGANIKACSGVRGRAKLFQILGMKGIGGRRGRHELVIVRKAGVPADNTAADDPGVANAFIIDTTNNDIYFCHTRVSSSSFTVVKVSP
jgi:hypothetical protein